jgi:hypothetical protein
VVRYRRYVELWWESFELIGRPSRAPTGVARDIGVAYEICSNLCQLPPASPVGVSTGHFGDQARTDRQIAALRLPRLWKDSARFRCCERMWPQLYLGQRSRDPEQIHRSEREVCERLVRESKRCKALCLVLRRIRLDSAQKVGPCLARSHIANDQRARLDRSH